MAQVGTEEKRPIITEEEKEKEKEEVEEPLTIAEENRRRFQEEEERKAAGSSDLWARLQNVGANDPAAVKQRQKQHHTPIEDKERKKRAKAKAKKRSFRTDDGDSMILPSGRGELRVAGTDICINSAAIKGFAKSAIKKGDYDNEDDYYYDYEDEDDYYDDNDDEYEEYYYHGSSSGSDSGSDDKKKKKNVNEKEDVVKCVESFVEGVRETLEAMEDEEKACVLSQGENLVARLSGLIENGVFAGEEELAKALDVLEKVQDVLKCL